jgi:hypothetical protein
MTTSSVELESARARITPADTGEALVNPGMGFTHYEYSNQPETYGARLDYADTVDEFPGLSTVYLRLAWGLLEPEEGRLDWSWFDGPGQRWIAKGKRLVLRLTTSESFNRFATPEWVYAAGARKVPFLGKYTDKYSGGPSFEPDFGDPIYLEKLDRFLAAAAARYDGDPNVDFIDIGTFGMWGEGHTWHGSHTHYPYETIFKHLKLHTRHFMKTRLVVNDNLLDQDYVNPEMIQYCLTHRMGIRNDSVCCLGPNSPFRENTLHMMRAFWLTSPTVVETGHYGATNLGKGWSREHVLGAICELHASYCSIHWWPREFLAAERPLIDEINRILGYRLQLKEASWPEVIRPGDQWTFTAQWANAGVAPLCEDAFPALTLKDARGGIAAVFVDENMNLRRVLPACLGQSSPNRYRQESTFRQAGPLRRASFSALPAFDLRTADLESFASRSGTLRPGDYDLYLSVGSRIGTPRIALPMESHDGARRYRLGAIRVAEPGEI